jgi:uncharacterized delta-60 repeat protein
MLAKKIQHLHFAILMTSLICHAALADDGNTDPTFGPSFNGNIEFTVSSTFVAGAVNHAHRVFEVRPAFGFAASKYWVVGNFISNNAASPYAIATARLLDNGRLDPGYGPDGTGLAVTETPMYVDLRGVAYSRRLVGVGGTVTVVNRIVVVGTRSVAGANVLTACSIRPDSSLDPAFGIGGCANYRFEDVGAAGTGINAHAVAANDGNVFIVGDRLTSGDPTVGVVKIDAGNGLPVNDFGFAGYGVISFGAPVYPYAVNVDSSGRLLVAAIFRSNYKLAIARVLSSTGGVDPTFCPTTSVCPGALQPFSQIVDVAAQLGSAGTQFFPSAVIGTVDNQVLIVGSLQYPAGSSVGDNGALVKLRGNGALQTGFGNNGLRVVTGATAGQDTIISNAAITGTGKILLLGSVYNSSGSMQQIVARLHSDGRCDTVFGGSSCLLVGRTNIDNADLLIDGNNRPLYLSRRPSALSDSFLVTRLQTQQDLLADGFE